VNGQDNCGHGHIAVVFESSWGTPGYLQGSGFINPKQVISIGFGPKQDYDMGKEADILMGGEVKERGLAMMPDYAVDEKFAIADENGIGDMVGRDLEIITSFTYGEEEIHAMEDIIDGETYEQPGGEKYIFRQASKYTALAGPLQYINSAVGVIKNTTTVDLPDNCATWALKMFDKADAICPLGVPELCTKKPNPRRYLSLPEKLLAGMAMMAGQATQLAMEASAAQQAAGLAGPPMLGASAPDDSDVGDHKVEGKKRRKQRGKQSN
jgi:hypothetical protein